MEAQFVGLASQPRALDQLCDDTRTMLRTIGPRVASWQDEAFKHCNICTPPPKIYECVICDFATDHYWVYKMHIESQTRACMKMAERKARAWSKKV